MDQIEKTKQNTKKPKTKPKNQPPHLPNHPKKPTKKPPEILPWGCAHAGEWVQKVKDLSYRNLEKQQERTIPIASQDLGIYGTKEKL